MGKHADLESLQVKAVTIAAIEDRTTRHKGGQMVAAECKSLDDEYRILGGLDEDAEISLRAVLKILFDFILHDAIEEPEEDWGVAMGIDERGPSSAIEQIIRGS